MLIKNSNPKPMTKTEFTLEQLQPLLNEFDLLYDGKMHLAVQQLDELLFLLFFVDTEVINFERVQNMAYDLRAIRESLNEIAKTQSPKHVKLVPIAGAGVS